MLILSNIVFYGIMAITMHSPTFNRRVFDSEALISLTRFCLRVQNEDLSHAKVRLP